jgi:hypothetical protein
MATNIIVKRRMYYPRWLDASDSHWILAQPAFLVMQQTRECALLGQ